MIATNPVKCNHPVIEVLERDQDRWQAAFDRWTGNLAHREGAIFGFRPAAIEEGLCRSYDVASYSEPGKTHLVELFAVGTSVYASCDCTAGQMSIVCQHAAGAMDAAGWWPFAIARQLGFNDTEVPLPIGQAPPALYRIGQMVRYERRRRALFTIMAALYIPDRGWLYELETFDGWRWPQPIAEGLLTPAINKRRRAA